MQVYKFGGASIATPEKMRNILPILREVKEPLVLVVSAIGKTTNALEAIVDAACTENKELAHRLAHTLESEHLNYAKSILTETNFAVLCQELNVFFTELQWAIEDADRMKYDYSYDQIVCTGELMSSKILDLLLRQEGLDFQWLDIRDVLRTDATYRDPRVDWDFSQKQTKKLIGSCLEKGKNVLTQGFIAATSDNTSVTLGREGSDYTAALLAAMTQANGVTIWKDVEGLKNADPKEFPNTVTIEAITYHEVIEMAFYGAQVIHPKTIKPLQNNNIPLYVRCFAHKDLQGSMIMDKVDSIFYPPLIVLKKNQTLLQITTRDFSFIAEENLSTIYRIFHSLKVKVNLIQNAAISFLACIDHDEAKMRILIDELSKDYKVFRNENVQLLTIRHYTPEVLTELTKSRYVLLEQKTKQVVQMVLK